MVYIEDGGGGGGGNCPPLFGHVCTLNACQPQHQVSMLSMQLNQKFCLRLHQKLSQSTKIPQKISGGGGGGGGGEACPQNTLENN